MRPKLCLFFALLLPLFLLFPVSADIADEMPEGYADLSSALPDEIRSRLPDTLFSGDPSDVASALSEIGDFPSILSLVRDLFLSLTGGALHLFFIITALLLLSRLFDEIGTACAGKSGLGDAFSFVKTLLLLFSILAFGYESMQSVSSALGSISSLTRAAIPLMGTLYAMGGNLSSAAASSAGLSASLAITEHLVANTVLPVCALSLVFSLVGTLTGLRTKSLCDTLKKNYTTLLSFLMVILLSLIGSQSALAAKADTLSAKGAKFAAGAIIPVAGGSVSELLLSVGSGVSYLRGLVGVCGLLLLFLSLLPSLLSLLCQRLVFQVTASLADLLSCEREHALLDEFASLCGYLFTALLISSSALLLSLSVLLHCATAWG